MSKSMLVVDTPKSCGECKLNYCNHYNDYYCSLTGEFIYLYLNTDTKSLYCPLLPLPEKKDLTHYIQRGDAKSMTHLVQYMHDQGWNDCVNEIIKEK